jgi:hypothetical protein
MTPHRRTHPEGRRAEDFEVRRKAERRGGVIVAAWAALVFSLLAVAIAAVVGVVVVDSAKRAVTAADRSAEALATADKADAQLREAELAACRRVQVLRTQANGQALIIYVVLRAAARGNTGPEATPQERRSAREFIRFTDRLTFTPPTDCDVAVRDPLGYRPHRSIRFSECARLPVRPFHGCPRR